MSLSHICMVRRHRCSPLCKRSTSSLQHCVHGTGDHVLGLPTYLAGCAYGLQERVIHVVGPVGLRQLLYISMRATYAAARTHTHACSVLSCPCADKPPAPRLAWMYTFLSRLAIRNMEHQVRVHELMPRPKHQTDPEVLLKLKEAQVCVSERERMPSNHLPRFPCADLQIASWLAGWRRNCGASAEPQNVPRQPHLAARV